jgi:hypothetical protein
MECPNCSHVSEKVILKCSACGEAFNRRTFEEFEHLQYLLDWVNRMQGEIDTPTLKRIQAQAGTERDRLRAILLPPSPEPAAPAVGAPPAEPAPSPSLQPAPVIAAAVPAPVAVTVPAPQPAPAPKAPPPPRAPLIQWDKLWGKVVEAAVSGLLLRWLRYFAAFILVVSLGIIILNYWSELGAIPGYGQLIQVGIIFFVPTAFYGGGLVVRKRMKLVQSGSILMGVGQVLFALDFAAIYQFGGLAVDVRLYWLITSLLCTGLYLFTVWRLSQDEIFGYIGLAGLASTAGALAAVFTRSPEWTLTAMTGFCALSVEGAYRLGRREKWQEIGDAARRFPLVVIPILLAILLFAPGRLAEVALLVSVALGDTAAALLAWRFRKVVYTHVAAWMGVVSLAALLRVFDIPWEWFAAAAGLAALPYGLISRRMAQVEGKLPWAKSRAAAVELAGWALLALAILLALPAAFFNLWAGAAGLGAATLALVLHAVTRRAPLFAAGAAFLFPLPFGMALYELLANIPDRREWLLAGWVGLGILYHAGTALLHRQPRYGRWLALTAQFLTFGALAWEGLVWQFAAALLNEPPGLPGMVVFSAGLVSYLAADLLLARWRNPALSSWLAWLPPAVRGTVFLYPIGLLIPACLGAAWFSSPLVPQWFGVALAGTAAAYVLIGQTLGKREGENRFPFHLYAYPLIPLGIVSAVQVTPALIVTLSVAVVALALLAGIYRRPYETGLAGILFLWGMWLALGWLRVEPHAYALVYVLAAGLVYVLPGIWLARKARAARHHFLLWTLGFGLSVFALGMSVLGRYSGYVNLPWVGLAVPLFATALYAASAYLIRREFTWAAAAVLPVAYWQLMPVLAVRSEWYPLLWVLLGIAYLGGTLTPLGSAPPAEARVNWRLPLNVGAWALAAWGVMLTLPVTLAAFFAHPRPDLSALTAAAVTQFGAAAFVVFAAVRYAHILPLFLQPWLVFAPVTLILIAYGGRLFGTPLTSQQFGIVWAGLGMAHVLAAMVFDQFVLLYKQPSRMHGVYLGGYLMSGLAVIWTITDAGALLWAWGMWVAITALSAVLAHVKELAAWAQVWGASGLKEDSLPYRLGYNVFSWFAAFTFPIWLIVLFWEMQMVISFSYLAYTGTALAYLGLAVWLGRLERAYAWPLFAAGQFYAPLALAAAFPTDRAVLAGYPVFDTVALLGYVVMQAVAVVYYAASSWFTRQSKWTARGLAYAAVVVLSAGYTVGWVGLAFGGLVRELAYAWLGLAAALLAAGFALDWRERRAAGGARRVGYAHAPHAAGLVWLALCLTWSWTPAAADRLVHLIALGGVTLVLLASHLFVHYGGHTTWEDFVNRFFARASDGLREGMRAGFLWLAVYAFPFWLVNLLAYREVPWAWRGLALALLAPLYVAAGLAARRVREGYGWSFFSAGYILTAVGAMVSMQDQRLAIYVLGLNALVYAVSAYLFRQAAWLYLTNALVPVISLMIIHDRLGALPAPWVAGIFMGLAYLYFAAGQLFDRGTAGGAVSPFGLAFYAPGYLLSALALAAASGGRELAIIFYLPGAALYALSAWRWRESVFLYPAVWLAAVPYYLGMTYTALHPAWYGIGWLPLILAAILAGRFGFHRRADLRTPDHPALPFYTLAYALSLSMMLVARADGVALAAAFGLAAALYLGSAWLFRRVWWLYPGLLAAHLGVLAGFAIAPEVVPPGYVAIGFLPLTMLLGILGARLWQPAHGFAQAARGWSGPLLAFAVLDAGIWQAAALVNPEAGVIVSTGHALLFGFVAVMWASVPAVWGSLLLGLLAFGLRLAATGLPLWNLGSIAAGVGFGVYLTGRLVEILSQRESVPGRGGFALWARPVSMLGVGLNSAGTLLVLPSIFTQTGAGALALTFAGAMYLAVAYRARNNMLGYAAVGMIEAALVLLLITWEVRQPQWFAIPAGLYFVGVGIFERRRGRKGFALAVESLGLVVMLVTSFIQSLDREVGGLYFAMMLFEGLVMVGWAAQQKRKAPFLIGLAGNMVNIAGQIVLVFLGGSGLTRWLIGIGVGLLLLLATMFAERWIIPRAQDLRERLEAWE